jgi:hypothetical protein
MAPSAPLHMGNGAEPSEPSRASLEPAALAFGVVALTEDGLVADHRHVAGLRSRTRGGTKTRGRRGAGRRRPLAGWLAGGEQHSRPRLVPSMLPRSTSCGGSSMSERSGRQDGSIGDDEVCDEVARVPSVLITLNVRDCADLAGLEQLVLAQGMKRGHVACSQEGVTSRSAGEGDR